MNDTVNADLLLSRSVKNRAHLQTVPLPLQSIYTVIKIDRDKAEKVVTGDV